MNMTTAVRALCAATFGRLQSQRVNAGLIGIPPHLVEQDCLAHAPQSNHEDTLGGISDPQPLDGDMHAPPEFVAAGKLGTLII